MKVQIGKGVAIAVIAGVVALLGWLGWQYAETPENRGLNEEAIFRAVEKKAKSNGVDLRTIPQWVGPYYKYHPEEKPATQSASAAPPASQPPGAAQAGAPSGQ